MDISNQVVRFFVYEEQRIDGKRSRISRNAHCIRSGLYRFWCNGRPFHCIRSPISRNAHRRGMNIFCVPEEEKNRKNLVCEKTCIFINSNWQTRPKNENARETLKKGTRKRVKIETLRTLFSHADQNPTGLNITTHQVNLCRSTCAAQPEPKPRVARLNGLNGVKIKAAKQMDLKNGSMEQFVSS